ncbi:MAG: hypothetical protein LBO03_02115 [Acidaminococcales bacterium]|jgi:hypothetical protein|nr:hypothetical protein [Acidaminococcales bacterium]
MSLNAKKAADIIKKAGGAAIEEKSIAAIPHGFAGLLPGGAQLVCLTEGPCAFADRLECTRDEYRYGVRVRVAPANNKNSQALRLFLKWTAPAACGGQTPSLGIEDDFGLLLPSFVESLSAGGIKPVLVSRQDKAESLSAAMGEAAWQILGAGLSTGYGAEFSAATDEREIMNALLCGYTGIVIDCRGKASPAALLFSEREAASAGEKLPAEFMSALNEYYGGKSFVLGQWGKISYTRLDLIRLALCYGEAIAYIQYIYNAYFKGAPWPIDLSAKLGDLTPHAHYLIGTELSRAGVRIAAVGINPLSPSFPANIAIAGALGHKLRIDAPGEQGRRRLLDMENKDKCLFDLRRAKGRGLLAARAVLEESGIRLAGHSCEGAAPEMPAQEKAALRDALRGHEQLYVSRLRQELAEEKALLEKLLGRA